jgi:hypothetical protein
MRTLWLISAVAVCLGTACARAGSVVHTESPVSTTPAPAAVLPPATDLTGTWATGSDGEPSSETITLRPACTYHPPVWIVEQKGNALVSWAFPESYDQGVARKEPGPPKLTGSRGQISGVDVIIDEGEHHYMLRYDVKSKHLRGTVNGTPFWAARQVVVRPELCPAVPEISQP